MKIYLSGPITDYEHSKELFKGAEELLRMHGHEVLNPHEFCQPSNLPGVKWLDWTEWMKHDLQIISREKPDLLLLLPDWERSLGAEVEVMHSLTLGVKVGILDGDKVYLHHEVAK